MRRVLLWLWALPVPGVVRRFVGGVSVKRGLRTLLVPQFMVGVVGLIADDSGRLLLLHHTYRGDYAWGLPTGFLEHHEQPADALARELIEETCLEVRLERLWGILSDPGRPLVEIVYRGKLTGGRFKPSTEVDAMKLCGPDDLPPLRPDQLWLVRDVLFQREGEHETIA